MAYQDLEITKHQHVAIVEIQRPPNNFFDTQLINDLADCFESFDQSHEVRAIECPLCHRNDRRYRTAADAMAHIESGFCASCKGESNAQQQIFIKYNNKHKCKHPHIFYFLYIFCV